MVPGVIPLVFSAFPSRRWEWREGSLLKKIFLKPVSTRKMLANIDAIRYSLAIQIGRIMQGGGFIEY
jgi:hypothetical protein